MRSAVPATEKMQVSGIGMSRAVAGVEAQLHIKANDKFGNQFVPSESNKFPFVFGVSLVAQQQALGATNPGASDKKKKTDKGESKVKAYDERAKKPLQYEGAWTGSTYQVLAARQLLMLKQLKWPCIVSARHCSHCHS